MYGVSRRYICDWFLHLRCKSRTSCYWVRVNDKLSHTITDCFLPNVCAWIVFPRPNGNGQIKRKSITKSHPPNDRHWTHRANLFTLPWKTSHRPRKTLPIDQLRRLVDKVDPPEMRDFRDSFTKVEQTASSGANVPSNRLERLNSTRTVECMDYRVVCWWVFPFHFSVCRRP